MFDANYQALRSVGFDAKIAIIDVLKQLRESDWILIVKSHGDVEDILKDPLLLQVLEACCYYQPNVLGYLSKN